MSATFSCVSQGRKTVSLDFLASYSQVQLSSSGQIGADQLQIGQLDGAIVALRIQELQQRSTTVVVSIGYGVANASSLVPVLSLVRLEQGHAAFHLCVGRIHVAEDLGARGLGQLAIAVDVDQRALLFALVAVEDSQRNIDAGA